MNKVFISHLCAEKKVAEKLITQLNNAFSGILKFAFSSEDLSSGQIWKEYIKEKLNESDMCIFIISPRYLKSYWCIIEFAAFWLANKKIFLLSLGDMHPDVLMEPMKDYHMTNLFSTKDNERFIEHMANTINFERIPFDYAKKIAENCEIEYKNTQKELSKQIYNNIFMNIETYQEKGNYYEIFEHNFSQNQIKKIITKITNMVILRKLIQYTSDKPNLLGDDIIKYSINILKKNNAELRKLIEYYIINKMIESDMFEQGILLLAKGNQRELEKILLQLYNKNGDIFKLYYYDKKLLHNTNSVKRLEETLQIVHLKMNKPE